jgi:hypothetical protein
MAGLITMALSALLAADVGADVAAGARGATSPMPASALLPAPRRGVAETQRLELKDAKDGTGDLVYDGNGFTARIAPDGAVRFTENRITGLSALPFLPMRANMPVPSLQSSLEGLLQGHRPPPVPPSELDQGLAPPETKQLIPLVSRYRPDTREDCRMCSTGFFELAVPVNWVGRFDLTDELTRFSGQDPNRQQKAVFLAMTRDQRTQMAVKAHVANIRRANVELPGRLQAIACDDRLTHKERRTILGALAKEMDPATPEGANASKTIDAFVARFDSGDVACELPDSQRRGQGAQGPSTR